MIPARWLLTGAGGQLGTSLLERSLGPQRAWTPLSHGALDIASADAVARVLEEVRPEVVVNAAAFTHVDRCESEPEAARRANAEGPAALARACEGRALLVHVSTEYVFPGDACVPIPEDTPVAPRSVYGDTKAQGEAAIRGTRCDHLIVRTQWLFGRGRSFVGTMLELARQEPLLRVVEDQLGRPTSTDALAVGLIQAIDRGLRGTLHLACEGVASWYDLARQVVALGAGHGLTRAVPVEPVSTAAFPRPAARPAYGVLGLERARQAGIQLPHWIDALGAHLEREVARHA